MICVNCGFETNENIQFCPACGKAVPKVDENTVSDIRNNNPNIQSSSAETNGTQGYVPNMSDMNGYNMNNMNGYEQQNSVYMGEPIKNYLTLNIVFLVLNVITICLCCGGLFAIPQTLLIIGSLVVSIIGVAYSTKVNTEIRLGNISAAKDASRIAKNLFITGMILFILKIIFEIIGAAVSFNEYGGFDTWWQNVQNRIEQNKIESY